MSQDDPQFKTLQPGLVIARLTTHWSGQLASPNLRSTVLGEDTTRALCRHTQDVEKANCGHHRDVNKLAITSPPGERVQCNESRLWNPTDLGSSPRPATLFIWMALDELLLWSSPNTHYPGLRQEGSYRNFYIPVSVTERQ